MPSFRRDRPERPERGPRPGPRPFRREEPSQDEPEVEAEGFSFRRPSPFRREEGPSQFASRPVSPSERKELWEVLVPEAEQEDPDFDYGKVFEMFPHWGRRSRPAVGPGPTPPPREAPPGQDPRFGRRREERPELDAAQFLDLNRVWSAADQLRRDQRFRVGSPVAVVRLAPQQEMHRFFRVQASEVQMILDELAYSINYVKPRDLPGRFLFQRGQDGFIWLAYIE